MPLEATPLVAGTQKYPSDQSGLGVLAGSQLTGVPGSVLAARPRDQVFLSASGLWESEGYPSLKVT